MRISPLSGVPAFASIAASRQLAPLQSGVGFIRKRIQNDYLHIERKFWKKGIILYSRIIIFVKQSSL